MRYYELHMHNPVIKWFGKNFSELDPLLQELHRNGGELSGIVNLEFGSGLAGVIGRKLSLNLGVKILDGGWYWVQRKVKFMEVPMPTWLFPSSHAYKRIKNGMYEFSVTLTLPMIGKLVSYNGVLTPNTKLV